MGRKRGKGKIFRGKVKGKGWKIKWKGKGSTFSSFIKREKWINGKEKRKRENI